MLFCYRVIACALLAYFFVYYGNTYGIGILADLRHEIAQNPERPKNLASITYKQKPFDAVSFCTTLTQFVNFHDTYLDTIDWVSKISSKNISEDNFFIYVQKIIVNPASEIICFGDIHGSIHSLVRSLEHLVTQGYLDNNFKIIKDNVYLVFLGDYVDRGYYGAEVLLTLCTLKLVNPDHVFVVRGNHENMKAHKSWGFHDELHHKFKNNIPKDLPDLIQRAYMRMPSALFIGVPRDNRDNQPDHINYILCCHGGPDFGFNPTKLLQAKSSCIACLFDFSHQSEIVQKYYKNKQKALDRSAHKLLIKGKIQETVLLKNIGFLWNDFDNTGLSTGVVPGRAWKLGKDFTNYLLSLWEGENYTVSLVMRGHQHDMSMYNDLVRNKGCYGLWDNVFTLFSAPGAIYTVAHAKKQPDYIGNPFNYDSFVRIQKSQESGFLMNHHWASCDSTNWNIVPMVLHKF